MNTAVVAAVLTHAGHTAESPGWLGYVAPVIVLLVFVVGAPWFWLRSVGRWKPGDDCDDGDDDGGGGPQKDPTPPPRPPNSDPAWWPEFERQFAAYVASRLTEVGA